MVWSKKFLTVIFMYIFYTFHVIRFHVTYIKNNYMYENNR